MTRILADTNIVLDVLLGREPHLDASLRVWLACDSGTVEGLIAAHAVTTVHFLVRRALGPAGTTRAMKSLLRVFRVAAVDDTAIRMALHSGAGDFEDQVSAMAANLAKCDRIVTRDPKGFRLSPVKAVSPTEFLASQP